MRDRDDQELQLLLDLCDADSFNMIDNESEFGVFVKQFGPDIKRLWEQNELSDSGN